MRGVRIADLTSEGGPRLSQSTDAQVRKLMKELDAGRTLERAADKAGMDRKTARKYRHLDKLPSELGPPRTWRTREDPLTALWPEAEQMLIDAPELEARALFDHLAPRYADEVSDSQLRTFQRRVREWRARSGPPKEVFFPQVHRPGEAMQTDFTWGTELQVTICAEEFAHLLCHPVLPYSGWEAVTICRSESMAALRRGVQEAVFELGCVPEFHQTDNSSAATHDLRTGKRGFNAEYESLMTHLGMKPRTIGVGKSEQNGSVEARNGALKRRLKQHLLLRGSRDFESVAEYELWLRGIVRSVNAQRSDKIDIEKEHMTRLTRDRLPEWTEVRVSATSYSTIIVKRNTYSVPSRLRGEELRVRIYEDHLEVYHGAAHQFTVERLLGERRHRINYRHVIDSLVRKPGALRLYKFRDDLFPTLTFRLAYDRLHEERSERQADLEYLRILHLAARTLEAEVETALELCLEEGVVPLADLVKPLVEEVTPDIPELAAFDVDIASYDDLLQDVRVPA
jgi:hypothetical protein